MTAPFPSAASLFPFGVVAFDLLLALALPFALLLALPLALAFGAASVASVGVVGRARWWVWAGPGVRKPYG